MKKFTLSLLVLTTVLSTILLVSCAKKPIVPKEPELTPYVSYAEDTYLLASDNNFNVEIVYYNTESPKEMDGKVAAPLVRMVKIAYIPLKLGGIDAIVKYAYLGQSGTLKKSAVRYELSIDFETTEEISLDLKLTIADKVHPVTLTNLTTNTMTVQDTLSLATDCLRESLGEELKNGFEREILIKIIPDQMGEKPFFYYVSFFKSPDKFSAVLIDPIAKKIVAKKL